eukprot:scaffold239972_cov31-Tisochrysis_lutea.AAC.1
MQPPTHVSSYKSLFDRPPKGRAALQISNFPPKEEEALYPSIPCLLPLSVFAQRGARAGGGLAFGLLLASPRTYSRTRPFPFLPLPAPSPPPRSLPLPSHSCTFLIASTPLPLPPCSFGCSCSARCCRQRMRRAGITRTVSPASPKRLGAMAASGATPTARAGRRAVSRRSSPSVVAPPRTSRSTQSIASAAPTTILRVPSVQTQATRLASGSNRSLRASGTLK